MKRNNIDLDVLGGVLERGSKDASALRLHKRVDGAWSFEEGRPAYEAVIAHGGSSTTARVDIAPGFGGGGNAPDPLQFLLAGLGACYAATVVTIASMEGAEVRALSVSAELDANVARVYDLGDAPLMEQVSVIVTVDADADDEALARWREAARVKCPFAYTVQQAVPLEVRVERG
jgi:uncharacterized OsmC-like protein